MSNLEKEFLSLFEKKQKFKKLSLNLGSEKSKIFTNLLYLVGKRVEITTPKGEKKVAIRYLFRNLEDGEYYTVLTSSKSLIAGLVPAEKGTKFNIVGRKTKMGDTWITRYDVEIVPIKVDLTPEDLDKIHEFLNERFGEEISGGNEQEELETDFDLE